MQNPPIVSLFDFTDKIVLVTGSSRGIGAGIALRFAEAGADLVVHYRSSKEDAQKVAQSIRSLQRRALLAGADLTIEEGVEHLVQAALDAYGRIDVLVNNAGIYPVRPFPEMTLAEWRAVMDANLTSAFLCTQAAATQMIAQGKGGVIINVSSIESQNPTPLHAHYAAAKAAVDQFSRTAALELAQHDIRVNIVSPGLIWSEGLEKNWPEGVERWLDAVPLKRLGMPADVADACLFLASPAARWITGANIPVDGGMLGVQLY